MSPNSIIFTDGFCSREVVMRLVVMFHPFAIIFPRVDLPAPLGPNTTVTPSGMTTLAGTAIFCIRHVSMGLHRVKSSFIIRLDITLQLPT